MRGAVFTSATAHAVIVAVVYFGLPTWFEQEDLIEETPVIVELVEIAERPVAATATPVVEQPKPDPVPPAPQRVAEAPPPPPPPAPEPPPPPPAAEPPPPEPAPPQQQVAAWAPPPTPAAQPAPPPPPAPVVNAPPKPQAKPTPPKVVAAPKPKAKPEAPKQAPVFDPTAIAALLDRTRQPPPATTPPQVAPKQAVPTPPQAAAAPQPVVTQTPQPARDVPLTVSEMGAFKAAIERCWSIPAGARDAQNLKVTLLLFLNQNGTLARPPQVVDGARMNRAGEETFRAAAESAMRAVQRCAPYPMLPAQKYEVWREINMTFDPSKVLAG